MRRLADYTRMGWVSRLRLPQARSLRVFMVSGFEKMLIVSRKKADGVDILRVVHGSRNLRAWFRRRGELD